MEDKAPDTIPETIPYLVHEDHMVRMERTIKRLWILCIIIFFALIGTNAYWIWYESQWEDQVITQDIDTGEGDAVVAGVGNAYGKDSTDYQDSETETR